MIVPILFIMSQSCPNTIIENRTNLIWNKMDQKSFVSARERCKIHYPKSPCLKKFIKVKFNTYYAVCGK